VWLHLNRQQFCPFQLHSNSMRTAANIWPDCRLETNSLCLRQKVGGDNIPVVSVTAANINSNVFDFYFLIWSLSRLLCCVVSGSSVAVALGYIGARTDTTYQSGQTPDKEV
jgi:hypothetical protein